MGHSERNRSNLLSEGGFKRRLCSAGHEDEKIGYVDQKTVPLWSIRSILGVEF